MPSEAIYAVVSCYSDFDVLAHKPRGTQANHALHIYELDPAHGTMVLVSVKNDCVNPAFSRFDDKNNMLYTCTEFLNKQGEVHGYKVSLNGALTKFTKQSAGGTSTCYITFDKHNKNMLLVNYWDATLTSLPMMSDGSLGAVKSLYDAKGKDFLVKSKHTAMKHVDHASNDASTIRERQSEPHLHALVLDPKYGELAFVPDLGMDIIRQFVVRDGVFTPVGSFPSGPPELAPHGPRYIEFHKTLPYAYVVNELGCNVCVFKFDAGIAKDLIHHKGEPRPCLTLVQAISTLPEAFPNSLNTCGRISVHPSGDFVLVTNRGHNSVVVFRISKHKKTTAGMLTCVYHWHSGGETPRHYQFDPSGQWLLVPNQDSDVINVFRFDLSTGRISFTGNNYSVPCPNFVCCFRVEARDNDDDDSADDSLVSLAKL